MLSATARVLVALILLATAVFVAGVLLERHRNAGETSEARAQRTTEAGTASRTGETGESKPTRGQSESSETLLGINPESTGLLVVAVAVSLLLAASVWRWGGSPLVLAVVAAAMVAFCALDIREVAHQVDESRAGLAVLAGVVAALHGAAALLAMWMLSSGQVSVPRAARS